MEMHNKLRALVVAPTPTWPLNYGNRKRIFSVCSKLKDLGFEIHYIHYASEGDWRDYIPVETRRQMDNQWDIVDHIWPSKPLHDWPKESEDHKIDEWWDWSLENHLKKTFAAREYDLVVVNYTWLSKALELAPKQTYKVLDTHDKFSGRRQLLAEQGIGKEFFHTTEDQEVIALNRADLVWAIKKEEEEDFKKMGTTAAVSTLLHIDSSRQALTPPEHEGIVFGFIGANNNINRVNIYRFIERATPIFRKFCAPLTIHIAGSICNELDLVDNPFFKTIGYVDSIDEFYDDIHAAIIPMEFSTGLKIKVAEALSHSKAMLSHKHAMEGFTPTHDYHELDSFEDMALAMVDIAYESKELEYLNDASEKSHKITEDHIWQELESVKDAILSKKEIVVILPKEYGDKKKLAHYIAQAKIDLLNWNFNHITYVIVAAPSEAQSHSNFIRFMQAQELVELIKLYKPTTIVNLSEELELANIPKNTKLISLTKINGLSEESYIQYKSHSSVADELYFPSIGHINLELAALQMVIEECWLIGEPETNEANIFQKICSNQLLTRTLKLKSLADIDKLFKATNGLPSKIFIAKKEDDLNYCEQLLVEMAEKYDIEIRKSNDTQLLFLKRGSLKNNYEEQFFPAWERFVNNVINSQDMKI